jgi:predicted CopG family antitoxin
MSNKSKVIRVTEEVYKALIKLSKDFTDTPDKVLRRLLGLKEGENENTKKS